MQPDYSALSDAHRQILRENFEARLVLCEMRRTSLNLQIDACLLTPEDRAKLEVLRDLVLVEWGEVMTELENLKAASTRE